MEGHLEDDALAKIWEKFTFICSTTAVQATTGPHATQDVIPQIPELYLTWRTAMTEIINLCHSYGIKYEMEQLEKRVEALKAAVGATTSCSRDLWSGKPSEVDDLLGSVVRMGKEQKVPVSISLTLKRSDLVDPAAGNGNDLTKKSYGTLILRDRIARGETLPIKAPTEGHRVLGPMWGAPSA
eukprot:s3517_g1.t1